MSQEMAEAATRDLLRDVTAELAELRGRLVDAHRNLPVSSRVDVMLLGEEEADFPTEIRRTIECTLADHLEPLIQALGVAADYKPLGGDSVRQCSQRR